MKKEIDKIFWFSVFGTLISIFSGFITIHQNSLLGIFLLFCTVGISLFIYTRYFTFFPHDFEIIERNIVVDLRDSRGEEVEVNLTKKIRALKNGLEELKFDTLSDGNIQSVAVTPGTIIGRYDTMGKTIYTCSLGHVLKKNEEIVHTAKITYLHAMTSNFEYYQYMVKDPARSATIRILFPPERVYKHFSAKIIRGLKEQLLKQQPKEGSVDGRPCLELQVNRPKLGAEYKVYWDW